MTLLRVALRSWLLVVLVGVAGGVGGAAALHGRVPTYRSSVQLIVSVPGATTPAQQTANRSAAVTRAFGLAQIAMTAPAVADARAAAGEGATSAATTVSAGATLADPFLLITVQGPDPAAARAVATAFVRTLPATAAALGTVAPPGARLGTVGPASAPVRVAPLLWRFLGAGTAAGLSVGLALALLAGIATVRLADPAAAATLTGWPLLATVPDEPGCRAEVTAPDTPRAEAYRHALTAIVHADPQGVRSVAVVGAGPGDGASALTANLVALLAAGGHDAVGFDPTVAHPAERLTALRAWGSHDLVLVDAGSLVPRVERPELLAAVDGVVVVTTLRHGGRLRAAARTAARLDVRVIGLVVNRADDDPATRPPEPRPAGPAVPVHGAAPHEPELHH